MIGAAAPGRSLRPVMPGAGAMPRLWLRARLSLYATASRMACSLVKVGGGNSTREMPWMTPLLACTSGLTTVLQMMPLVGEQSQRLQVRWQKPPCHCAAREDCRTAGRGVQQGAVGQAAEVSKGFVREHCRMHACARLQCNLFKAITGNQHSCFWCSLYATATRGPCVPACTQCTAAASAGPAAAGEVSLTVQQETQQITKA